MMDKVDAESVHEKYEDVKARVEALRANGELSGEAGALVRRLVTLVGILMTVVPKRTTRKGPKPKRPTGAGLRKVTPGRSGTVEN